jgi:hypothetical protein
LSDPAYQETQGVDCCLVGPVNVLNDQGARWRLAQLIEQSIHDLVALTRLECLG